MQPQPGVNLAPVTAPVNPIVVQQQQQPIGQPAMVYNAAAVQAGAAAAAAGVPPLMLQPPAAQPQPVVGQPAVAAPGLPAQPPVHVDPALGVGLTPNETLAQNIRMAQNNRAYEPQEFRPADPDPYRMYWFRELNGHWAVFPRRTIDRLNARWYSTDEGVFYAVRLSD